MEVFAVLEIKTNYSEDEKNEIIKGDDKSYEKLMSELNERGEDNTYKLFVDYYKRVYRTDFEEQIKEGLSEFENDKNIKNLEEEKGTDNIEKETPDEDNFKNELKEKVYANYYEMVFEQYSFLLINSLNEQKNRGKFSITDKQGTELVLYERYLQNLDAMCKNNNVNLYRNDDIKKVKEDLNIKVNKLKGSIEYNNNKDIDNIRKINSRRNEISKRLDDISISMNSGSNLDYSYEIESLRKEYMDLTYRLRIQEPTLEDIELQARTEEKNQEFAQRTYGDNNEIANMYSVGINIDDQRKYQSGDSKDPTKNAMETKTMQTDYTNNQAQEMLRSAKEAVKSGNYKDVEKYLNVADMYISGEETSREQIDEGINTSTVKDVDKSWNEKEKSNDADEKSEMKIRGIDKSKDNLEEDKKKDENSIYSLCRDPKNLASNEEQLKLYYLEQIAKREDRIKGIEKENEKSAKKTGIDYVRVRNNKMG